MAYGNCQPLEIFIKSKIKSEYFGLHKAFIYVKRSHRHDNGDDSDDDNDDDNNNGDDVDDDYMG